MYYYIPAAYIVGGMGWTVFFLFGVEYFMPRLAYSLTMINPTFAFAAAQLSTGAVRYTFALRGASNTDIAARMNVILSGIEGVGDRMTTR